MQLTGSSVAHAQISVARASAIIAQTTELVRQELISIVEHNREIEAYINKIKEMEKLLDSSGLVIGDQKETESDTALQVEQMKKVFQELIKDYMHEIRVERKEK